jgi:hypothetical protein
MERDSCLAPSEMIGTPLGNDSENGGLDGRRSNCIPKTSSWEYVGDHTTRAKGSYLIASQLKEFALASIELVKHNTLQFDIFRPDISLLHCTEC